MINVADNYRRDPNAFARGYEQGNALRERRARIQAGETLAAGNYAGSAAELATAGLPQEAAQVSRYGQLEAKDRRDAQSESRKATAEYIGSMANRLLTLNKDQDDPGRTVQAFDQYFAQGLADLGETPEEIQQLRGQLGTTPREALMMLGAASAKEAGYDVKVVGNEALVFRNGQVIGRYGSSRPEWKEVTREDGSTEFIDLNSWDAGEESQPLSQPGSASAAPAARGGARPQATDAGAYMDPLIQQESGGDGNAIGPQTRYGRALGSTQMLPETAEEMARKLGVPWRPDLMRGDTERALAYQRQLGQAYLQEGLDEFGGDLRMALMRYHGGPDQSIWGPKTRAYADSVMARMERDGEPYEVAAAGDTPALPSGGRYRRTVPGSAPKKEKAGYRMLTADEKADMRLPADSQYQVGPEGQIGRVAEGRSDRPPTEGQVNTASLTYAAFGGNDRMNDLARRSIFKPKTPTDSLFNTDKSGTLRLVARTDEDRQFMQAAKEFLAPILRKDTGAAVTDSELAYYMDTYIPRFEDSPQVLWQKAQARDRALRRLYGAGRRAYDQEYGPPGQWQVLTDPRANPNRAPSGPPAAAVEHLRANPNLRGAFDRKYGAGAAAKALRQ